MAKLQQMQERLIKDGRERAEVLKKDLEAARKEEAVAKKAFDAAVAAYHKKADVSMGIEDELKGIKAMLGTIGRTL